MGIFKKYRAGYSHECANAFYQVLNSSGNVYAAVPAFKNTSGDSYSSIYIVTSGNTFSTANWSQPYGNLTPVLMSVGLYESALNLIYDSTKTYYTDNTGTTEADMSGYSDGDTITDNVYYCTYDVEDYDIATNAIPIVPTISRAYSTTTKKRQMTMTLTLENTTGNEIIIKSIKFHNKIPTTSSGGTQIVLACGYYLNPSEYVTIPAGETGSVVAVFEFGEV